MYFDETYILSHADEMLGCAPIHITDVTSPLSEGGIHDFYSNGDYWWPDPHKADGLPYIRRDGLSNPDAFTDHRKILLHFKNAVADLAAGYNLCDNEEYAKKACALLKEFFVDEQTKMNPSLCFAQAIPGICSGRGIGIIDTLHLIDLPYCIEALKNSPYMDSSLYGSLKKWFADYLLWMRTHEYGITEMNETNNHGVCWFTQASVYAHFTDDTEMLSKCRKHFKTVLLPNQMAADGSFPAELARTKPYNYSLFVVDNMCSICMAASVPDDNLWEFALPDGRCMKNAIDFIYPYIENKALWPYAPDVEHFEAFPAKASFLLFAGIAYKHSGLLEMWQKLPPVTEESDSEAIRNVASKQPYLWL